jgi:hypothetical protein
MQFPEFLRRHLAIGSSKSIGYASLVFVCKMLSLDVTAKIPLLELPVAGLASVYLDRPLL